MQINQIESALEHLFFPGRLAGKLSGPQGHSGDQKFSVRPAQAVEDSVSISNESVEAARRVRTGSGEDQSIATIPLLGSTDTVELRPGETEGTTDPTATANEATSAAGVASDDVSTDEDRLELTDDAQARVRELQQTDREVRAHENAHVASGGSVVAGGPSYSSPLGPTGGGMPSRARSRFAPVRHRAIREPVLWKPAR